MFFVNNDILLLLSYKSIFVLVNDTPDELLNVISPYAVCLNLTSFSVLSALVNPRCLGM